MKSEPSREGQFDGERRTPRLDQDGRHATRTSLDASRRSEMEAAFGHDFSAVRVHTDGRARAMGARALTEGNDIHFAPGAYAPETAEGRHLLVHELAHVVQQGGRAPSGKTPDRGGERAAHAAADQVAVGGRADVAPRAVSGPQLDDGTTPPQAPKKDEDPVVDGLKTVGKELLKNEKVKKELIQPVTDAAGARAKREWGSLSTGEKAGLVTFGAGTVGLAGGALLSDPGGRKVLSGVNLAAPVGLIPYATLQKFTYTLPDAKSPLWKFETGFDLTDVLKLGGDKLGWKGLSLSADLKWNYDPVSQSLTLAGGTGKLGLLPGLSVEGGTYPDLLKAPKLFPTDAGFGASKQSLPEGPKVPGTPDVRVMVTFDVMKFAESGIIPGLGEAFGYSRKKKR
ncbi:eCIS core domain-containing protein [Actinopolymorpha pittospori]